MITTQKPYRGIQLNKTHPLIKTGIIYKATNMVNGKCYVGQTVRSLRIRRDNHINLAHNKPNATFFCRSLSKHGEQSFIWEVLAEDVLIEDLNLREISAIKEHGAFGKKGYRGTRKDGW